MRSAKGDFKDEIEAFCELLRKRTTVGDFLKGFDCIIARVQDAGLVGQYRFGR